VLRDITKIRINQIEFDQIFVPILFDRTDMRQTVSHINLALRATMELGIVTGLAYWGYQAGTTNTEKVLLAIITPVLVFSFWGLVDFRQAGRFAEPLRLIQELLISGLAALALYHAGQHIYGWLLAAISIIHHALVYPLGERLLKH
jgi:hypothetical protein